MSANSPKITAIPQTGGAESGAVGARNAPIGPDLLAITDAWPTLLDEVKAEILAIIRAASGGDGKAVVV